MLAWHSRGWDLDWECRGQMCRGWLSRRWLRLFPSFCWGEKCPSLVLNWHVLRLFCPVRASLRRGPSVIVISGIILGDFRLKFFDAATLILGPSNVRWSALYWLSYFWRELGLLIISCRKLDFLTKSFPPGRLRWVNIQGIFIDQIRSELLPLSV